MIEHPFYGVITVQPSTLTFDRSQLNITKITGTVLETINDDGVKSSIVPADEIQNNAELVNNASAEAMELEVVSANDVSSFSESNLSAFEKLKKIATTNDQINALTNAYNAANSAIVNATQFPVAALLSAQSVLTAPARWELSFKDRFEAIKSVIDSTITAALSYVNGSQKRYFEGQITALMTSVCVASVTPHRS